MDQRRVDEALGRYLPRLNILALAFGATVVVYIAVAWFLLGPLGFEALASIPRPVIAAIAIAQLAVIVAGYVIGNVIRRAAPTPQTAGGVNRAAREEADEAMGRYLRSLVVASALREVAAIVGLVLTLLTGEIVWVAALGAAALVSMLIHWPRRGAVQDYLEQQRVAR